MVEVRRSKSGIRILGHAEYAPYGRDIVCAGVSALTETLAASIEQVAGDSIQYAIKPGTAYIEWGNLSERAGILVDSFFIGIRMIAAAYPQHVRIV